MIFFALALAWIGGHGFTDFSLFATAIHFLTFVAIFHMPISLRWNVFAIASLIHVSFDFGVFFSFFSFLLGRQTKNMSFLSMPGTHSYALCAVQKFDQIQIVRLRVLLSNHFFFGAKNITQNN